MRIYIFYSMLIVFSGPSVFGQCTKDSVGYILWQKDTKLRYEDFRGDQDTTFLIYGSPANGAAMTKIEATFIRSESDELTFSVVNKFLTEASWIKNRTPIALSHEQGHFDISEVYTRKIRKALGALSKEGATEAVLTQTVNAFLRELDAYQQRYDDETHHGFILRKQKAWEDVIQYELNQLREFE